MRSVKVTLSTNLASFGHINLCKPCTVLRSRVSEVVFYFGNLGPKTAFAFRYTYFGLALLFIVGEWKSVAVSSIAVQSCGYDVRGFMSLTASARLLTMIAKPRRVVVTSPTANSHKL